jgi:RecB family exonuclease
MKIQTPVGPAVEHGRFIHEQLENFGKGLDYDAKAKAFVKKLEKYLEITEDEIVKTEEQVKFMIDGYNFVCVIDAITKKDIIIDYKITSAPSNYANKVGYQLPIYHIALGKGTPKFLLFKVAGKERKLAELQVQEVALTEKLIEDKADYVSHIIRMIEMCVESGQFPPSYQGCRTCFYKAHCPFYVGG